MLKKENKLIVYLPKNKQKALKIIEDIYDSYPDHCFEKKRIEIQMKIYKVSDVEGNI